MPLSKDKMRVYMRDRTARLRNERGTLKTLIHSGITVKMEIQDGVAGLYVSAKFNQEQLDALEHLARLEHTDSTTMVQDMLTEAMLAWRRERDQKRWGQPDPNWGKK